MRLVIGNKNYSSWSLRPWILMKHARIKFNEVRIPLFTVEGEQLLEELCPAKQVPVLYDGPLVLWDSLAICEYIADKFASKRLWPETPENRALARAMSAEMHSSFHALRAALPMNCRNQFPDFKHAPQSKAAVLADIARIEQLLNQALEQSKGPWLFGHYTVADAMYAPVASRFKTYGIQAQGRANAYFNHVLEDASIKRWYADAEHEAEVIEQSEYPFPNN